MMILKVGFEAQIINDTAADYMAGLWGRRRRQFGRQYWQHLTQQMPPPAAFCFSAKQIAFRLERILREGELCRCVRGITGEAHFTQPFGQRVDEIRMPLGGKVGKVAKERANDPFRPLPPFGQGTLMYAAAERLISFASMILIVPSKLVQPLQFVLSLLPLLPHPGDLLEARVIVRRHFAPLSFAEILIAIDVINEPTGSLVGVLKGRVVLPLCCVNHLLEIFRDSHRAPRGRWVAFTEAVTDLRQCVFGPIITVLVVVAFTVEVVFIWLSAHRAHDRTKIDLAP